jgi:hypothetical protein
MVPSRQLLDQGGPDQGRSEILNGNFPPFTRVPFRQSVRAAWFT